MTQLLAKFKWAGRYLLARAGMYAGSTNEQGSPVNEQLSSMDRFRFDYVVSDGCEQQKRGVVQKDSAVLLKFQPR